MLVAKKAKILIEYLDFLDVFLEKKTSILLEAIKLNQHVIGLQKGQQSLYNPIYILEPVELKTLKAYIKINLANSFIWFLKLPVDALILFVRKPNSSFCLYVDYRSLNKSHNQEPVSTISYQ